MSVLSRVSLKLKIMGMVMLPIIALCPVIIPLYLQGIGAMQADRDKAASTANTIALDSVITSQKQRLEKSLTTVRPPDSDSQTQSQHIDVVY
jgi:hypothetical protein